jgi:hypothetical protein
MGPAVSPFERAIKAGIKPVDTIPGPGERILFTGAIYDATDNPIPPDVIRVTRESINTNPRYGRYLWIINEDGLWLILEATPNPAAKRKMVCHTNITGGGKALQGGELWFGHDGKLYFNFRSGRYGGSEQNQFIAIATYFKYMGYTDIEQVA